MSKFQQRHYEAVAAVMKDRTHVLDAVGDLRPPEEKYNAYLQGCWDEWNLIQVALRKMFQADNPGFKPSLFDAACAVPHTVRKAGK